MPLYDLMVLLDPGAPSDRQDAILKDVQGLLEKGGKLVGTYDWGTRRMTFEIDHRPEAAYHLFQFETESGGALLDQVDHSLKIMDGVLRHRIIRLKDGSPPPPMPRPERGYSADGYDADPGPPSIDPAVAAGEAPAAAADAAPSAPATTEGAEAPATPDAPASDAPAPAADAPAEEPAPAEAPAPAAEAPAPAEAAPAEAAPAAEEPAPAEAPAPAAEEPPVDAAPAATAEPDAAPDGDGDGEPAGGTAA